MNYSVLYSRSYFSSFNIVPYFIYTDFVSRLLEQRLVDPGSTLMHVGEYDLLAFLSMKSMHVKWSAVNGIVKRKVIL